MATVFGSLIRCSSWITLYLFTANGTHISGNSGMFTASVMDKMPPVHRFGMVLMLSLLSEETLMLLWLSNGSNLKQFVPALIFLITVILSFVNILQMCNTPPVPSIPSSAIGGLRQFSYLQSGLWWFLPGIHINCEFCNELESISHLWWIPSVLLFFGASEKPEMLWFLTTRLGYVWNRFDGWSRKQWENGDLSSGWTCWWRWIYSRSMSPQFCVHL